MKIIITASFVVALTVTPQVSAREVTFRHITAEYSKNGLTPIKTLNLVYQKPDGSWDKHQLKLENQGFSTPFKYNGPNTFGIALAGSNTPFHPVTLPKGNDWLMVFIPTQNTQKPYTVNFVDNSKFDYGSYRVFNISDKDVGIKYANHRVKVLKGKSISIKPTLRTVKTRRFQVDFYTKENNGVRRFSATRWSVLDKMRTILFLYRDPKNKRMTYKGIDDYLITENQMQTILAQSKAVAKLPKSKPNQNGLPPHPLTLLTKKQKKKLTPRQIKRIQKRYDREIAILQRNGSTRSKSND